MNRNRGAFDLIYDYANEHLGKRWAYRTAVEKLASHPPGFLRSICLFASDADIGGGSFTEFYCNGFGLLTVPAIHGYERIGAARMVEILKTSLCIVRQSPYAEYINVVELGLSEDFFDGFVAIADRLDQLDSLYRDERESLPGANRFDSPYLYGPIDYYYETVPEDFGRQRDEQTRQ